ncbi:hypothetical protein [Micromonospora viridifaciens]|nr:hypothetical protein [Micromonospora viridifaciens]
MVTALQEVNAPAQNCIRVYRLPGHALDDGEHLAKPRVIDPRGAFVI